MANPNISEFDVNGINLAPVTEQLKNDGFFFGQVPPSAIFNTLLKEYSEGLLKSKFSGVWEWEDTTSSTRKYNKGALVEFQGNIYRSLVDNNVSVPNVANWLLADSSDAVKLTGNQTIAGVKTFTSSPIVPTPTTATQVANKSYVDGLNGQNVKLTGNQTIAGVKTFSSTIVGNITGNSGTATKLQNTRTINGVAFDGSANITVSDVTAVKLTGNQTIAGVKTFSSSPIVPTPTANTQAANKVYVDTKAPLNSPALTGVPTAPTAAVATNNTQIATTAFVKSVVTSSGGFTQSFGADGWTKLPNGLIIQWGGFIGAGSLSRLGVTFPIAFPNALFKVITGGVNNNNSGKDDSQTSWVAIGRTGFTGYGYNNSGACTWIAIGY